MKNRNPKISIGLVVYNGAEHIKGALDSIVKQSYKNIELIIVDGGSTDGTLNSLDEFSRHISVMVSEPDKGIYDAMNKVCSLATGDWLIFLGCDDVLQDALGNIAGQMTNPDAVYYGDVVFRSSGRLYGGEFSKYRLAMVNFCHQSIFYPRSVYKKYAYSLDYKWLADYAYNLKLVGMGIPFVHIAEVVAIYNEKGGSSSGDVAFEKRKIGLIRSTLGLRYAMVEVSRRFKVRVEQRILITIKSIKRSMRPYVWKIRRATPLRQIFFKLSAWGDGNKYDADIDTISQSGLIKLDYYCPPLFQGMNEEEALRRYVRSWAIRGVWRRKLFPGFHPGIYLEQHGVECADADPLADYLRAGQPQGPWNWGLITSYETPKPLPMALRVGLHIHVYYPDIFPNILRRLERNRARPDLLISVTSESARREIAANLDNYYGGEIDIRVVPNRGRDIGPFLTEFGETIRQKYDLVGHLHTKKTVDLDDDALGRIWFEFLLDNLLGEHAPMADIILGRMAADQDVMMVFPDDPNIVGWGENYRVGEGILSGLGIKYSYQELCFPIGTMFWARATGLQALLDLNLDWEDYPEEPLAYDGTLLHALERLFGILASYNGGAILQTYVPGSNR
ncbi:MAG: rhamnan synthesis F family protein [Pseudomonadota bacterium]